MNKMCLKAPYRGVLASMLLACTASAQALTGAVTDADGEPLEGGVVTIIEAATDTTVRTTTSVFSDASGEYRFEQVPAAPFDLRIRRMGWGEQTVSAVEPDRERQDFVLKPADRAELLRHLPANVWAERIGIGDPEIRNQYRITCMLCHQQGYELARWPKNIEQWESVFDRMAHRMDARLTTEGRTQIAQAMLEAYNTDGELGFPRIPRSPSGKETQVEITEWVLPHSGNLHDVAPGPDGKVYGADMDTSIIQRLDPEKNTIVGLTDPKSMPEPKRTLHSTMPSIDGRNMWFTYSGTNTVASLDTETDVLTSYTFNILRGHWPHTMRFDQEGTLWFTLSATNQIGYIDDEGDIQIINVPTKTGRQWAMSKIPILALVRWYRDVTDAVTTSDTEEMTTIYGIDIGLDGKVWFSLFNARQIGSYDPKTGEFDMIDTPFGGPRRFRIDSEGDLWIPAFAEGMVYRYSPVERKFYPYEIPTGKGDAQYSLTVHPKDDSVWLTGSNSDTLMRLDPETREVKVFRLPSRVTWTRELYFDEAGNLWTSYSNMPVHFIEGGTSVFVRVRFLDDMAG
jgi:virginiamycin B lyase